MILSENINFAVLIIFGMEKDLKIVCLDGYTVYPAGDSRWARFSEIGVTEIYDRTPYDENEIISRCIDADAVLTNKTPISARTIAALPRLKYIGVLATGYNIVDTAAARSAGVTVTNIPAYSTASVAQMAISLLLAITNRVEHYAAANRNGRWAACEDFSYRDFPLTELAGKIFGVVGLGNTGSATAAIARALGMKVAVYSSKPASALPDGYVKMELDELFQNADVVSLHCPLTEGTRHLVNATRLAMMKPSAILINTGRGPLVDEAALAEALDSGKIYAAGVDVLSTEPPAADNPLLSARNCFITPHIAWASDEARERLLDIAFANVKAFFAGKACNVVG